MDYTVILLYVFTAAAFAYQMFRSTVRKNEFLLLLAFSLAAALIFWGEGALSAILICGVVIFSGLFSSYGKRSCNVYLLLAVYYLLVALLGNLSVPLILQSAVIGVLSAPRNYLRFGKAVKKVKPKMKTELPRNVFQIISGVVAIGLFLLLPWEVAALIMFCAFLIGLAILTYAIRNQNGIVHRLLSGMEREGTELGKGAIWLGVGVLFATAFLNSNAVIVIFGAVFIADSFSTLAGITYGKSKLPYNQKKSYVGTATYALIAMAIAYPILGVIGIPIGILAALVEGLPLDMDDNFSVSLIVSVALRIIY